MEIIFSNSFQKAYTKLDQSIKRATKERLAVFRENEFHPELRNHGLKGKYRDYRSISITGDYRAHYRTIDRSTRFFVAIGTHSQLYKK